MKHLYIYGLAFQLAIALAYTYHTSRLIKCSFYEQRLVQQRERLRMYHERLAQRMMALEHGPEVAEYARMHGMVPARISQVHL